MADIVKDNVERKRIIKYKKIKIKIKIKNLKKEKYINYMVYFFYRRENLKKYFKDKIT